MSQPKPAPANAPATAGTDRRWSNVFIVLVLAYQVGMPLTYYVSDRVYDERFSWRMFSTVRLQACDVVISESLPGAEGPVDTAVVVERDLQVAWVNILQRLRPSVIAKYLARRCEGADAQQVTLVGRCHDTDGTSLPVRRFVLPCDTRELREESAP
jgi:hypothetical protein